MLVAILLLAISCRTADETGSEMVIEKVYESSDLHTILYDTDNDKGLTLVSDTGAIFIVLDQTPCNEWLIAERSPATAGPGRIETEHLLFHIPGRRHIDIESLNPLLSSYGITFLDIDGKMHLLTPLTGSPETVSIPLLPLLGDSIPDIPVVEEHQAITPTGSFDPDAEPQVGATSTDNRAVVLELMLQTDDARVGEALVPRITDDGVEVNSVISYTARDGKIYIVESIQYRVLVYDYNGNFIKAVNYPPELPGREGVINIRGIATDGEYLYLLSPGDNSVYVIDAETEDIADIIEEGGRQSGRFINLADVTVDHGGVIRIHDRCNDGSGEIYTFRREGVSHSYIMTEQYSHYGQMVPGRTGSNYQATVEGDSYVVVRDEYELLIRNLTPMGLLSAEVRGTDTDGNVYVLCEERGGQIAGPFNLKVVSPQSRELYSLETSFWDGGGAITERVVITPTGEVFDACFDGDAFRDLEEEPLLVTKLIIGRLK